MIEELDPVAIFTFDRPREPQCRLRNQAVHFSKTYVSSHLGPRAYCTNCIKRPR